ncbi:MAG TPA: serine/threonine-protein kinase [Gemmatimonadaceae bacterium]|nr:serine/threonine-protein kinase [Gemmatimonadaceae bacterium]
MTVLALLGSDTHEQSEWGSVAFLAREEPTGALVIAALNERVGMAAGYDVTLWRSLEESLPGPMSWCPQCGTEVEGWTRYCSCGADLSGIAPGTEEAREALVERVRQSVAGEFELLGSLPYAGGGGPAYFARRPDGGVVVALRMHADGTFDDGTQRISLSLSEPLGEMGSGPSSVVGRSPYSGPVRFTPADSISVVTDETAARRVSGNNNRVDSSQAVDTALGASILGSGLLAQQPTPAESEAVAIAKVCPQCGVEYDTASRFCPNDGTPLRPKGSTDPFVGRVLAERYHMLKRLGEGGMGKVYLAEHVKMNRQCAVKVMNGALLNDSDSAQRFAREASNAARIIHPNVAAVFDYGETDGVVYLVMEYVEGEPLTRLLERETALSPARAVDIARQVAEALVAAHELGIVHRDLKPDNIIVAAGRNGRDIAKVVDFGIAKAIEEAPSESLTRTGLVIGTPEYMSPEQLLGDPVDARSDIYSLGCILYQMLTGRRTFDEPTREQMIKRRLTEKAPHPRELVADVPKTLDLIVARMLNRTPQDRYGTAAEVRDLLIPAIALEGGFDDPSWRAPAKSNPTVFIQAAEQPTQEMTPYPGVVPHRRFWRRPEVLGAAAVAIIAAGAAATVITRSTLNDRARARVLEQAAAIKPPLQPSITVVAPSAAQLPKTGASAAAKLVDSALPAVATRPAGTSVSPELRQPIEQLRAAIESRLPSKMEEVYRGYDQDEGTKKFFRSMFDRADSIHVKSIAFENSNVRGNTAELNFKLTLNVMFNGSKLPTEVPSTWRADLVREGQRADWKLQRLVKHGI